MPFSPVSSLGLSASHCFAVFCTFCAIGMIRLPWPAAIPALCDMFLLYRFRLRILSFMIGLPLSLSFPFLDTDFTKPMPGLKRPAASTPAFVPLYKPPGAACRAPKLKSSYKSKLSFSSKCHRQCRSQICRPRHSVNGRHPTGANL
jgi:hypothetical protein